MPRFYIHRGLLYVASIQACLWSAVCNVATSMALSRSVQVNRLRLLAACHMQLDWPLPRQFRRERAYKAPQGSGAVQQLHSTH